MLALAISLVDVIYSFYLKFRRSSNVDDEEMTIFDLPRDRYNGVTLDTARDALSLDENAFRNKLKKSIDIWEGTGVGAVTIFIRLTHASLVPVCASLGFEFHHAKADYVFMLRWLPRRQPCKFPRYGSTYIGVGGLVVNDNEEILVVQERYFRRPHWKLPGGLAEPGEDLQATAVREVREETGIATRFVCVLCFRHAHFYQFGCADLYFVCLLRPLLEGLSDADIRRQDSEIEQCQWMPIEEYATSPLVSEQNRFVVQLYLRLRGTRSIDATPFGEHRMNGIGLPNSLPRDANQAGVDHFNGENYLSNIGNSLDFVIVQNLVPSHDGRAMNACYSVDRIPLD